MGSTASVPAVLAALEHMHINTEDLHVRVYDSLGIDDARDIRDRAALRGLGAGRVFIIVAHTYTTEAQNALLKTLEEPAADATFVLVVASPETLLSTLRSRVQALTLAHASVASGIDVPGFVAADPAHRIELLKPLTAADERDTGATLAFLGALEHELASRTDSTPAIKALYRTRQYLLDKGALRKPLLESLALALP